MSNIAMINENPSSTTYSLVMTQIYLNKPAYLNNTGSGFTEDDFIEVCENKNI